jgi:hypothetical protein
LDIDGWLRGIGLEQYAQTFRDNAIDADLLCDLTHEHLRELSRYPPGLTRGYQIGRYRQPRRATRLIIPCCSRVASNVGTSLGFAYWTPCCEVHQP